MNPKNSIQVGLCDEELDRKGEVDSSKFSRGIEYFQSGSKPPHPNPTPGKSITVKKFVCMCLGSCLILTYLDMNRMN